MDAVSNSGPLIALAKLNRLNLLKGVSSRTCIPRTVSNELLAKNTPEGALLRQSLLDFIEVHPDPPAAPRLAPALPDLDPGERQAITLAHHLGTALLMDDRAGRAVAAKCGLIVIGTAGLFVRAKRIGLLTAVVPLLQDLRDSGYWLSDSVVDEARRLAGE